MKSQNKLESIVVPSLPKVTREDEERETMRQEFEEDLKKLIKKAS